MGFLDDLKRKAADIASRAYDEVNQWDDGKNWNQRTAVKKGKTGQKSGLRVVGDAITEAPRYLSTGVAEVANEVSGRGAQQRRLQEQSSLDTFMNLQRINQQLKTTTDPMQQARLKQAAVKIAGMGNEDFQRFNQRTAEIQERTDPVKGAASVASTGFDALTLGYGTAGVQGAKLALKQGGKAALARELLKQGGQNALLAAPAGALAPVVSKGADATAQDIATGAVVAGGIGAALPAGIYGANRLGAATGRTAQHAGRLGYEQALKKVSETADTINVNPNVVPGATKQLDQQRVLAYANKIANGDQIDPVVVSRTKDGGVKVLDGEHRAEAYRALNLPVPTREINGQQVADAWVRANDFTRQRLVPGGTLGGPLGRDFAQYKKEGKVFEGVDGKPRFEVDDSKAQFGQYKTNMGRGSTVGEMLDHPEMFANYPDLKGVKIWRKPKEGNPYKAEYTDQLDSINIREDQFNPDGTLTNDGEETLLHELQHAIQKRENFASGGSLKGGRDEYMKLAGEAEARAVQARMNMPMSERYVTPKTKAADYVGSHQAPTRGDGDYHAPASDVTSGAGMFPDDIYTDPRAHRYYGHGGDARTIEMDKKSVDLLRAIKGKPDAEVTIYRAVPKGQTDKINPGDWVTLNKDYALQHSSSQFDGKGDIIEMKVKADEIYTDGNSVHEFGYDPRPTKQSTFYDSLDVPKEDLIIRNGDGVAMSIEPGKDKPSRFANRTVQNSDEVSTPLKKMVKEEQVSYAPRTNEGRLAASEAWLKGKSNDKAFSESIDKLATGKMNDQDVVNAIAIAKKLDASGKEDDLIKATEVYGQLSEHLTKKGQEVQAASLLSNRTPEGLRYSAQRDLQKGLKEKGRDITPEQINEIKRHVDEIKKLDPKSDEAAFARYNLAKYVTNQIPAGAANKIVNFWRAGLLTAPTTTAGNVLGNTGEAVMRKALVNPVATAADMVMSLRTGKRTFSGSGGFAQGAQEGAGKLGRFMKTGYDERQALSKYDAKELNYGDSLPGKVAGGYVNGTYRLMSVADQPFWYGARNESLKGIANVEAINRGLKGAEKKSFVDQFMKNPPKEAMEQATQDAKYATFQNETMLGTGASSLKRGVRQKSDAAGAVLDFFLPFTQVPSSIATRVVQRTPVGTGVEVVKQIIKVKNGGKFDQRAMSKAIGEGSVGTAIFAGGYALANSGMLTFGFPEDAKERELWEAEGKQPYSVRVGDRWYSLNYLQPFGTLLAVGGEAANAVKEGANATEAVSRGIATAGQAVMNQSFLKGVSGVLDAIDDPKRYAEDWVENTSSSSVPNFVRSFARASDPLQRDAKGLAEGVQGAIPGLRQGLPAKQDMFGRDLTAKDNFANQYLNPLRPSKVKNAGDVSIEELRRLQDAGEGVLPSAAKKNAFSGHELTREQVAELNRRTGEAMKGEYDKLIKSDAYKSLSDADKKSSIEKLNRTVYGAVKNQFGQELGYAKAEDLDKNQKRYLQGTTGSFISMKKTDGTSTNLDINGKLAKNYRSVLEDYDVMSTEEREKKFRTQNDAEFKYLEAKYQNDKANGSISEIQDIKRRKELAKAQIGSQVSKDARELYGMSKTDMYDFINQSKNGDKLAKELIAYDRALYDAGLVSSLKYKNGLAPSTRTASSGRRSSGGRKSGGSRSKGSAQDKALAERDDSDRIAFTAATSRLAAKAKVNGGNARLEKKVARPGIKQYKKAEKTNVSVRRNIT